MNWRKIKSVEIIAFAVIALLLFLYAFWSPISHLFPKINQKETNPAPQTSLKDTLAIEKSAEQKLQDQVAMIVESKNMDRCKEIQDKTYQIVCQNNIAMNLAQEKQDPTYCQKVDGNLISVEECDRRVMGAKMSKATSIDVCQQALTEAVRKECESNLLADLSQKKGDISICDGSKTVEDKDDCYDNYIFQNDFFPNADGFQCAKFHKKETQSDCKIYQENYKKADFNPCQSLKSKEFYLFCMISGKR